MKQLNILQICLSKSWGGMEMLLPIISKELINRGYCVKVICSVNSKIAQELKKLQVPSIDLNVVDYVDLKAILKIRKIIKANNIDVIHSHASKDLWLLVPALYGFKNVKLILTKHLGHTKKKKDPLHKIIYKRLHKLITISETVRNKIIKSCPIEPNKVKTIYNGIDIKKYRKGLFNKGDIQQKYHFETEGKAIGIVGRIDPGKGQEEFIRAGIKVLKEFPKTKFIIIGTETLFEKGFKKKLIDIINDNNLSNNFIFTGYCDNIPEIMTGLDMFVCASHQESFGLVVIEAMAMELPVIGTNAGGIPEIIDDGISGLLVPPKEVTPLAEAIKKLLEDDVLCSQLAKSGRKVVEDKFSLEKNIRQLEEVYYS